MLIEGWKIKQPGFFDVEERLARLHGLGDQPEAFSRTVDFEVFRPIDPVLMFKILVIQTLNNLSNEQNTCSMTVFPSRVSLVWDCLTTCLMPRLSGCFVTV